MGDVPLVRLYTAVNYTHLTGCPAFDGTSNLDLVLLPGAHARSESLAVAERITRNCL